MSAESLSPAMCKLTVKTSPVVWDTSALGKPAEKSYLGLNFAGAPTTAEVRIGWKWILVDAVHRLGGTNPIYFLEDSMDGKFQARVTFTLVLDSNGTKSQEIDVIGVKCSTMFEAESEASAAAFQLLQHGHLGISVKDVSHTRCKDLEKRCHELLAHACEVYHVVKSLISNFQNDMHKSEMCYAPDRLRTVESFSYGQQKSNSNIILSVAEQLANLTRKNYLTLKELDFKTDKVKTRIEKVHERVTIFFRELSLHQASKYRGDLPQEIELRMELVLQELMVSIGWEYPKCNIISSGTSAYACETTLCPNSFYAVPATKALTVTGPEASSKEEAVESSCKAAILLLESENSVCLVNVNYNHRSNGELYVVETKETLQSAYFMGSQVLAQWEAMVNDIYTCAMYCEQLTVDQPEPQQASLFYKLKSITMKAVNDLHKVCLADLQFAKWQLKKVDA